MRPKCDHCQNLSDVTNYTTWWMCAKCWLAKFKK